MGLVSSIVLLCKVGVDGITGHKIYIWQSIGTHGYYCLLFYGNPWQAEVQCKLSLGNYIFNDKLW